MSSAKFISFEGTEGVGKTTAIKNFCDYLDTKDIRYIKTREPGGSPFAETLRELLLNPDTDINNDTELLLMFAARADHLNKVILPALAEDTWVICDRFTDSTIAYQGFGRYHGQTEMLNKINQLIANFVSKLPDQTIWLDLPIKEGMARAAKRSLADRFEQQKIDFFERIYQGYQHIAASEPKRFIQLDASGNPNDILNKICQTLNI